MLSGETQVPTWSSDELVAPVIDSLVTGTHRELPLNLPNSGQCPDLPDDAVVESICIVDSDGMRGRDAPQLPGARRRASARQVATQELTVAGRVSRATGTSPRRPSSSTRSPDAATCSRPRPWSTSFLPAPPSGCRQSSPDDDRPRPPTRVGPTRVR